LNQIALVDLALKNCKILVSGSLQTVGLAIDNGKIVSIATNNLLPKADRVIDCKGKWVIPGGIDAHVHFRAFKEDWRSGSASAVAGGVTFVIDHGFGNPPSTSAENLNRIKTDAESKSFIDFGINGSVNANNLSKLPELAKAGVMAFGEVYMAESVGGSNTVSDGVLLEAFRIIGEFGGIVGVHAENGGIVSFFTQKLKDEKRKDQFAYLEARPVLSEIEAVSRALMFARYANVRLHIYHLTTLEGVKKVVEAKKMGQRVSAETCPHYLLFEREDLTKYGPYIKCNPPIRSKDDRTALWKAIADGGIDMVSTDHWPSLKSEKEKGWNNIWEADSGIPGVETRIPLLLTFGVNRGLLSMEKFVKIISENPAKTFGIYPQKGVIWVGSDADLTVIDFKKKATIKAENLQTNADFTPYEGWEVQGIPVTVFVRGQMVMHGGKIVGKAGCGQFVSPSN
jgi:dihydroorotase